ncbi:MAG: hypothetical protein INR69_16100 [Mucilaginibacter polytrichastri]|nr:hypothetical protein [Mucilaginibacter polytrichastri]
MNTSRHLYLLLFSVCFFTLSCDGQPKTAVAAGKKISAAKPPGHFTEGNDYTVYQRVRMLDKTGFSQPAEAYSFLLPKGWKSGSEVIWVAPGQSCMGTFQWMKASSPDGRHTFEMFPDISYGWTSNEQLRQMQQGLPTGRNCGYAPPMDAETYLRRVFAPELGNPQIVKVEPNAFVVREMQQYNEAGRAELMQYGAGQVSFNQTAINATVRWPDGTEGLVVFGISVVAMQVPNAYNGTYDMSYTTQTVKRTVFRYPEADARQAAQEFGVIVGSFRSNPAWSSAVKDYWRSVRQQRHVEHIGRIRIMDEQTKAIGNRAVKQGAENLANMDTRMRNWEAQQSAQDRMHTSFIKTIREVEHYRDETGKVELSSGYNHAWSRSDGSSFILSDNPNFDPSSAFQDQRWKEMRKVDD